jgi:hypothetical protein
MYGYRDRYRDYNAGTENWANLCKQIQWGLVSDCSVYMTPSNTPTGEGVRAKNCITNGALLSAIGLYLTRDPIKVIELVLEFDSGYG